MTVERSDFGTLSDGGAVERFTLRNAHGTSAEVLSFGAIVKAFRPAGGGRSVILGYDTLAEYQHDGAHHGGLMGRYANRIAFGSFDLDGRRYELSRNRGTFTLHGGFVGFDRKLWAAEMLADGTGVRLAYTSVDGEEGFPGTLMVTADYALSDADVLSMTLTATTDAPTVINMTNHAYLNLSGAATIEDHHVAIAADFFTPNDREFDADRGDSRGRRHAVRSEGRRQGRRPLEEPTIRRSSRRRASTTITCCATDETASLSSPRGSSAPGSRQALEVWTTEPGMQFYTGQFLGDRSGGRIADEHARSAGLCLETQHFPDSPHHANFPSTVLRPGERFFSRTEYRLVAG